MASLIKAQDLTLRFTPKNRDPVTALAGFSLTITGGEFVSIVGPSGCGKSTFLNVVLGLIKQDSGTLELHGKPITGPGQERAMVFQEFGLLPWRTIIGNVELGLELKGVPARERMKRADELIKLVGLNGFERHYPHEQTELLQIWERTKKTVLFVTHSIEEAAYLSDRVIVMTARPGRTKDVLRIELPRPRDYEMRLTPEFNEIKLRIWEVLKEELTGRGPA
jgi:NitT/TauT family transport system ATP-binding protein